MRIASLQDKSIVVDILSKSFEDNISVNYVIKSQKNRGKYIRNLMDYSFNVCFELGEIWVNDNNTGCVLLQYSEKEKTTVKTVVWDIKALFNCFGVNNVKKILSRQKAIKSNYPFEKYMYLWYIGVDPKEQGKGIGTQLLKEVFAKSKVLRLPILLETSMEKNIPWYQNNGFSIYKELDFSSPLYLMSSS